MKKFAALWNDESGAVLSTELVLLITILGIGMIVGLTNVRNAVVQELSDVAAAVGNLNQSYSYSAVTGHASLTAGGAWADVADFCEGDEGGAGTYCTAVNMPGAGEL
jgi:Flp pilus assembly pilin Flp